MYTKNGKIVRYQSLEYARSAFNDIVCNSATSHLQGSRVKPDNYRSMHSKLCDLLSMNSMIVMSLTGTAHFSVVVDRSSILNIPSYMCLSEVIDVNSARPFIDFDMDISEHITSIATLIEGYYKYLYNLTVTIAWLVSKDHDNSNKKYHCIISGIYLNECWKQMCMDMCGYIESSIKGVKVDYAVYRNNASLRMPGQYKLVNDNHVRLLEPISSAGLDIYAYTVGRCSHDIPVNIHTSVSNKIALPTTPSSPIKSTRYTTTSSTMNASNNSNTSNVDMVSLINKIAKTAIPAEYVMSDIIDMKAHRALVRLDRVLASHCVGCNKIHNRENAHMIVYSDGSHDIRCFSASKVKLYRN